MCWSTLHATLIHLDLKPGQARSVASSQFLPGGSPIQALILLSNLSEDEAPSVPKSSRKRLTKQKPLCLGACEGEACYKRGAVDFATSSVQTSLSETPVTKVATPHLDSKLVKKQHENHRRQAFGFGERPCRAGGHLPVIIILRTLEGERLEASHIRWDVVLRQAKWAIHQSREFKAVAGTGELISPRPRPQETALTRTLGGVDQQISKRRLVPQ